MMKENLVDQLIKNLEPLLGNREKKSNNLIISRKQLLADTEKEKPKIGKRQSFAEEY